MNQKLKFNMSPLAWHISNQAFLNIRFDQGLCLYYLPNIGSKWNKFKWEILNNSNYDHFHGGRDFSHAYVIMHKYFGKKPKMQKMST
jgi:hypothetical protein